MASPQPVDQPTDDGLSKGEQEAVAALTAFIAEAVLVEAVTLPPRIYARLLRLGLRRDAVQAAATLTLRAPFFRTHARGPRSGGTAAAQVAAQEPELRARYLLAAARRITRDLRTIVPTKPGETPPTVAQRLTDALRRERRHWRAHVDAQRNRRQAAREVDRLAQVSPWWEWQTANDARVEADCRRFAGRTFTVADPPRLNGRVVFPGAVHPHCRCRAVGTFDPSLFGSAPTVS